MGFRDIIKGYKTFHRSYFASGDKLYEDLVSKGQQPHSLVIACSDSRTDPAIVMNAQPGELFVVRNVAAIVPPYFSDSHHHGTSAAIEFAVRSLKVKNIVVMGHSLCGGVHALDNLESFRKKFEFLPQWVEIGKPALEVVADTCRVAEPEVRRRALEQGVVMVSLKNLMTFPWISAEVEAGRLALHGLYLDLADGQLLQYDPKSQSFGRLSAPRGKHAG